MPIRVLALNLVSKIPAGEVIERPSVAKELIMTWLQTNGSWLAAMATIVLAIATFVIVRQNKKSREDNRLLLETSPIKELIISVINPIVEFASDQKIYLETKDFFGYGEAKNSNEARKYLKTDKDAELLQIEADAFLFPKAFSFLCLYNLSTRVNQTLYGDFKRRFKLLASKIDAYNPQGFTELLLELLKAILSQNFRNKVQEIAETSNAACGAMQPWDSSWTGKLKVFCAYLVFNKLLGGKTNPKGQFSPYLGTVENAQMLEEFWRENSEVLMAIVDADEDVRSRRSQVLQESDRLGLELEEIGNQLSKEKNRLRLKYNFTDKEIETSLEEQSYSEYSEQEIC